MRVRYLYLALIIGFGVSSCRAAKTSNSDLEAARVSGTGTYVWVHNVVSSEEVYNANNRVKSS